MSPDFHEPVSYRDASGGTVAAILISAASLVTGTLAGLGAMELPGWVSVLIAVVVFAVIAFAVLWALRSATTLEREHVRITGAVGSRTVPWREVGTVHGAHQVFLLVDGEWLPLPPSGDPADQHRTVVAWWTAHRGTRWRPPAQIPPTPTERAAAKRREDAARPYVALRGWWVAPAIVTGFLGAPISLALISEIGFVTSLMVVGIIFSTLGVIALVAHLVGARRRRASVSPVRLLAAIALLVVVALGTIVLPSALVAV
ncbi:hypothetical protein [Pseudonocardia sp. TRM90224]|uniref:hypothetical protein n=1 Tax=Pseudonocardia sp. TRM90224 TaxID=2812678 RepID=UPI001E52A971|nr:hypothetical protein [Pseudonocardia sp. TRM90224]